MAFEVRIDGGRISIRPSLKSFLARSERSATYVQDCPVMLAGHRRGDT